MKKTVPRAVKKLNINRKQRKWWQRAVHMMAMVVVFCTTYALILPAITMEQEPICGLEAHEHMESCYVRESVREIDCGLDSEAKAAHTHGDGCYTRSETPVCEYVHVHNEACYEAQEIVCELTTNDGHIHEETCYSKDLTCELEEIQLHAHTEDCLTQSEQVEDVLICELEVHIHEDSCYPAEEEDDSANAYHCGSGIHAHVETCYDEAGELVCTIPEHAHDASCAVEDLDLTADVETQQQWEQTMDKLVLTGNWPKDVLAAAETQLGYKESVKNVILEADQLKGYTRYGDWYGIPYGDWCAMYASFCLHYAGVEEYPLESEVDRWIEALTEAEYYATSDMYTGKPGDLIFFDYGQKRDAIEEIPIDADHVGIVVELIAATEEEPAKIKTIEGNVNDEVAYVTYDLDDPAIIGYGKMPFGEVFCLTHEGPDYTVTVTVGKDALIPDSAQLAVREIEEGTEEYNTYYQQALAALKGNIEHSGEEEPQVSFARFFDIGFAVDGVAVEPAAPVDIQIHYSESIAVTEEENGMVVHFAKDGVEVLDADTYAADPDQQADDSALTDIIEIFTGETEQVDTFQFTQGSFSVSGTLVANNARSANQVVYKVDISELDGSGNTDYVIYTQYNNRYYAIAAPEANAANSKLGIMVPLTSTSDGGFTWSGDQNVLWTFRQTATNTYDITNENGRYLHPFYNGNGSDIGVIGTNSKGALLVKNGTGANEQFRVQHPSSSVYVGIADSMFQPVTNSNNGYRFYIAALPTDTYNVWFDGTLGGMMSYYGADNKNIPVTAGDNGEAVVVLPETWNSSTKYPYTLRGWYDINNQKYYAVNPNDDVTPTATITGNTVFYADWIAATYDVGQNNEHVVDSLDTNDFITTHVFDYNALFNVLSQSHTGTISATSHSESWTIYNNGETVPYNDGKSLGFSFVDYDSDGEFSYALMRDNTNINQSGITSGILAEVQNNSGQNLLDLLFNPNTDVIGKYYAGTGNYLFQYMDSTTANYDGEHDGYYYLDARLNAASYNQSQQRFYLYDYLERTSDSAKDGGAGQYSDLLPFNSPYLFDADQVDAYTDSIRRPGYEYDAKDGGNNYPEYNSLDDAHTNYFFGLRTEIEFFLPNDTNTQDEYGNYGNISTRGDHMVFDFHGDDDVWVFVDGQLLLDIGGLHGIMHGRIDFSTGTISYGADGSENVSRFSMGEGTHTMTVYYMERGSSQSNCAIYFNIAPRYDLEITKEDIVTANKLDGAVFSIFNDEAMTEPAELWNSFEEHESGAAPTNTFTVEDGIAKCWGISAGKTYYIYETTPPPGYPESDDMIRITLNNRGTATIETTTLHGKNEVATEGFAVIKQEVNDTLKIVALTVTNQKEGDTTEIRVEKTWDEDSVILPQYITVYLTADGERIGRSARLTEANGWSYTWTGLPKYRTEGIDQEIEYVVEEVFVPDYITVQGDSVNVENYVDWVRVDQMSDSKVFLLVHDGMALTYDGAFGWMDRTAAEAETSLSAHWKVTTDHDGFHLKNELGYTLTYGSGGFYGIDGDAVELNQVFYYLNSRLMVHDHDVYYQFGTNGSVVLEDGLAFQLYQKETLTGLLTNIVNKPVDEEKQTFVEVNKVWGDGAENHETDSVVIHLYADGKDTGRQLILNEANNWAGSFDDLPYYQDGTTTPIVYTVVEGKLNNYMPTYSDPVILEGRPVSFWQNVQTLTAGEDAYRIYANGYSLAVATDNDATTVPNDLEDTRQQWKVVSSNRGLLLQNIETNRYLCVNRTDLTTTNRESDASVVALTDGYITVGGSYLELGSGYAGVTGSASNIDRQSFRITRWVTSVGMSGTGYTVTNLTAVYELPSTGAMGTTFHYAFGGLLAIAAALMYINKFGRKRRRGGKYSR